MISIAPGRGKSGFSAMRTAHERQVIAGVSVGLSALAVALFASEPGKWNAIALAAGVAVTFLASGMRGLRASRGLPALSAAQNLLRAGRLSAAESLLTAIPSPSVEVEAHVALLRARIAMRRGDPRAACDLLDSFLHRESAAPSPSREMFTEGRGLRAWARAAKGDAAAREDIAFVRSEPGSSTVAHAHAVLAEAFLAQRAGDRANLAEVLRGERRLLMYGLDLAEIARLREELRDDVEHRLWIERVAPALLATFERTVDPGAVPGALDDEVDADELAETEALAEEEAASRVPVRRVE